MSSPDGGERRRTAIGQLSTLQQRFEESRTGQVMISGLVAAIVFVGAAWNLPASPIKRSLVPVLKPTAVVNLNQTWSVYAPSPIDTLNTLEVRVGTARATAVRRRAQPIARVLVCARTGIYARSCQDGVRCTGGAVDAVVVPGPARVVRGERTRAAATHAGLPMGHLSSMDWRHGH